MKHTHNAKDLFPTWYKSIEPLNKAIVESRVEAIHVLLQTESRSFWIDIVRLALGLEVLEPQTLSTLITEFKKTDVNFPLESNGNVIKVLSGILLCFLFESENSEGSKIAMAIKNAVFFEQYEKSNISYYEYACDLLDDQSVIKDIDISEHNSILIEDLKNIEKDPDTEIQMINEDYLAIIKSIEFLKIQNTKLKRETNVLWWLFGQYSFSNKAYFSELGVSKMILTAAQELSELSHGTAPLASARHLLYKALLISNDNKKISKKISVADVIRTVSLDVRIKIIATLTNVNELTPCLKALSLSLEFNDEAVWKIAFKGKVPKADIEKVFDPVEIALQFYNEIMFLKIT